MIKLYKLKYEDAKKILKNKIAKYLSQHKINRYYLIKYNDDNSFINSTYENDIKIGESYGKYKLYENENGTYIDIKYESVFESPHISSPFNKNNFFYVKLFDGYTIGPLYSTLLEENNMMLPVFYNNFNSNIGGIKILNFY